MVAIATFGVTTVVSKWSLQRPLCKVCLVSAASAVVSSELQLRRLEREGEGGIAHVAASLFACVLSHADTTHTLTATSTILLLLQCTEEVGQRMETLRGGRQQLLRTLHAMLETALHSPALNNGDAVEVCLAMCTSGMATQRDTAEEEGGQILHTLQVACRALRSTHTCDVWERTLDALESDAAARVRATAQLAATAARAVREGHRAFSLARTHTTSTSNRLHDEVIELL